MTTVMSTGDRPVPEGLTPELTSVASPAVESDFHSG